MGMHSGERFKGMGSASRGCGVLPCLAYNVTLETTGSAMVGQALHEYEANVLARAAVLSGSKKLPEGARCVLTVNQDGTVAEASLKGSTDAGLIKKLKTARFAKIPGLSSSGTLKLDFSFSELDSPPYRREAIAMHGDNLIIGDEKH
ncbi:MAG: hypothetical protein IPM23_04525 [Candidatus Melainabacteria bacterium]|nr:hypothetical protein [Candidatus Melainabacteria bacterium]